MKSDHARRKKTYKLIQHKLFQQRLGCSTHDEKCPTYVYPLALKQLVRAVFPEGVCDYPDPSHSEVPSHWNSSDCLVINCKYCYVSSCQVKLSHV
ncbi:hypothetical protein JZ751_006841 [Albula glossodonta]|uniref:Uncharacterized protein n=1 Tax=Albula glossodonta TaxID=121402 RepID=A0A8T2P402_9TELE|nr:hypothetical protein JZ751_006841 [Albula glossodonta]